MIPFAELHHWSGVPQFRCIKGDRTLDLKDAIGGKLHMVDKGRRFQHKNIKYRLMGIQTVAGLLYLIAQEDK